MYFFFNFFVVNIFLAILIAIYGAPSQIESSGFKESHEVYNNNNVMNYNISKHVFYWLYTRDNINGQLLNRSEPRMIESTMYNVKNPIKLVVHGWFGNTKEKESVCTYTFNAYSKIGNYNVICVDWRQYSYDVSYIGAVLRTKCIGKDIAQVLNRVTHNLTEGADGLHLIGHSLGAHIIGYAGKVLKNQVSRITGLDPARPLFENNKPEDRLNATDAVFVDVIHTNGDKNGIFKSLGDIDFFPNGGKLQPHCCDPEEKFTGYCSHRKSYLYFVNSIWAKSDYVSYKCVNWDNYTAGLCNSDSTYMGEHTDKRKTGDYFLKVNVEDK